MFSCGCGRDAATEELVQADQNKLQGTWIIVGRKQAGKEFPPAPGIVYKFSGSNAIIGDSWWNFERKFTLDVSSELKAIEMWDKDGKLQETHIYKFDGDKLVLCHEEQHRSRPSTFESTQSNKYCLYTLEREK